MIEDLNGNVRRWQIDIPEGRSGPWRIERYAVGLGHRIDLTDVIAGSRMIVPGEYTRLVRDGADVWMSDTPMEFHDHEPILHAKGRILIHGLGLGIYPNWLLQDPDVEHVDIVEIDHDIIDLVAPWLRRRWGDRVRVVHGNAFDTHSVLEGPWDLIFSDIWVDINVRNLPEMEELQRLYAGLAPVHECWGMSDIVHRLTH